MARKGKEPAGLRRYRLEQKRKKAGRRTARAAPKRKVKSMARRRSYGRKRRSGRRTSTAMSIGAGIGMLPGILGSIPNFKANGVSGGLATYTQLMTGYNPVTNTWSQADFMKGGAPLLGGVLLGAVASKIPFIRSAPKRVPLIGRFLKW